MFFCIEEKIMQVLLSLILLKNQYLRMVIDRECFLCPLIGEINGDS